MTKAEPLLPSNRAFVVQFRATTELAPGRYAGHVEHLVSGQATHFESWEQCQLFIEQILVDERKEVNDERHAKTQTVKRGRKRNCGNSPTNPCGRIYHEDDPQNLEGK